MVQYETHERYCLGSTCRAVGLRVSKTDLPFQTQETNELRNGHFSTVSTKFGTDNASYKFDNRGKKEVTLWTH